MTDDSPNAEAWISAARAGSPAALGAGLEACRRYLLRIAEGELHASLKAKAGASDLVQEAFVDAQRLFGRFAGNTEGEWRAWLRQILLNKLGDFTRRYHTDKRDVSCEARLGVADSSAACHDELKAPNTTPSVEMGNAEDATRLTRALATLPADFQQVIRWRHEEDLPFEVIGNRLGKTANAARKLWGRAILQLQSALKVWP